MLSGGLKGGEWDSSMIEGALKTESCGIDITGKIAVTTIGFASPGFSTLFTYGCESWTEALQQECDDGMFFEPQCSAI